MILFSICFFLEIEIKMLLHYYSFWDSNIFLFNHELIETIHQTSCKVKLIVPYTIVYINHETSAICKTSNTQPTSLDPRQMNLISQDKRLQWLPGDALSSLSGALNAKRKCSTTPRELLKAYFMHRARFQIA